jgi:transcriptional regulator with XRE-family HTH domain
MPTRSLHLQTDDTQDIGWRLHQLRLRRGLSLRELAERSGKHVSQLSRLERRGARSGQPKPATVSQVLDALDATPAERTAIFHVEAPALTSDEIAEQVAQIAREYGKSPSAYILLDEHWYRWYLNPSARAVLGLSPEEYERSIGNHGVVQLVDSSTSLYHRYADSSRRELFSLWAASFRFHFADQQFDRWYLDIEAEISKAYWARQIWESPPYIPEFADSQVLHMINPKLGILNVRVQLNQMMKAPRFVMVEITPADDKTARKMAELRRLPGLDAGVGAE